MNDLVGRTVIHVAALVRALAVVVAQVGVEVLLHVIGGLVPLLAALHPEVFVQQRPV